MSKRTAVTTEVRAQEADPVPVWSAPMLRTHKMQMLAGQLMGTAMRNHLATATLVPFRWDAQVWDEMQAIQQAVIKRCGEQQQTWVDGCKDIYKEYSQLRMANTLSKFVEQECNVVAQFQALLTSQMAGWAGLMENIQVDYAYWLAQKQAQALAAPPA